MVVTQDGNKNVLPIAFSIVEGETLDAWHFYLRHLCRNVTLQEENCFNFYLHEAIKGAF